MTIWFHFDIIQYLQQPASSYTKHTRLYTEQNNTYMVMLHKQETKGII